MIYLRVNHPTVFSRNHVHRRAADLTDSAKNDESGLVSAVVLGV